MRHIVCVLLKRFKLDNCKNTKVFGLLPCCCTAKNTPHKLVVWHSKVILAETVGFEPTCQFLGNRISSAARYNHFDTSPNNVYIVVYLPPKSN